MLKNERQSTPFYKKIILFLVSFFVLALQLFLFYMAFIGSFQHYKLLYICGLVVGYLIILFVINKESSAGYKITWIVLILILPLFFSMLYLLNYSSRRLPRYKQKKLDEYIRGKQLSNFAPICSIDPNVKKLANLIYEESNYLMFNNTAVKFFNDAALKHIHFLEHLKKAEKYIFMEFFIISDGELIEEVLPLLEEKGKAGVEIKILYDDIGSRSTFSKDLMRRFMAIPNLKLCVYEPLGMNINPAINYRDHRKIVVIDGKYAYCGGDNLADEYIHKKERFGFWRDNAVFYEGKAVSSFLVMFSLMWFASSKEYIDINMYFSKHEVYEPTNYVIPFADGPDKDTHIGYDVFQQLISSANEHLYISTPYFIIDDEMINAICQARHCGVDVKLLVPKIPDKKTVFMMTRAHYRNLLKAGCEIYEFTPGFNHAKNIMVDGKYAFCGTINMDYRSLFLHFECGAVIINAEEVNKMEEDFLDAINKSELITYEAWEKRNIFSRFFSFLLRIFAPML